MVATKSRSSTTSSRNARREVQRIASSVTRIASSGSGQQRCPGPRVPAAADHGTPMGLHRRYAGILPTDALVEAPRRGVGLQDQEIDGELGMVDREPGAGPPHERRSDAGALVRGEDVKVVD